MAGLIDIVRRAVTNPATPWVLFQNGTVVFLPEPVAGEELSDQAVALLREWGPVHAGSPAGDFSLTTLPDGCGWAVRCHHNGIITFLSPKDVEPNTPDVRIGLLGRQRRDLDAHELSVSHVEPGTAMVLARSSLEVAYRDLDFYDLSDVVPSELAKFVEALDAVEDLDLEIASLLATPRTQAAGCLALVLRPSPEGLEVLWKAIDDLTTFSFSLTALAGCLDRDAASKARKRLLLGKDSLWESREASQRTCCLLELVWQVPDLQEWIRTRITDFHKLCLGEWVHDGRHTRQRMVSFWKELGKRLPDLCLRAPQDSADLLGLCWPKRWRGPFPGKVMRPFLVHGDPGPLVQYLLDDGAAIILEDEEDGGCLVVRETAMAVSLPALYAGILKARLLYIRGIVCQLDPGR
jgi:hypothetical protein